MTFSEGQNGESVDLYFSHNTLNFITFCGEQGRPDLAIRHSIHNVRKRCGLAGKRLLQEQAAVVFVRHRVHDIEREIVVKVVFVLVVIYHFTVLMQGF